MTNKNDIYIECFPTGEDGKVLFEESLSDKDDDDKNMDTKQINKIVTNPIFLFVGTVIGMAIILKTGKFIFEKISSSNIKK